MLPATSRGDFYETADRMGFVMRRLLAGRMVGMAVEGIGTGIGLWIGGVPMPALIGILTGLLTFIPNIGAFITGVLIVLVGLRAGWDTGTWAIGVSLLATTWDARSGERRVGERVVSSSRTRLGTGLRKI